MGAAFHFWIEFFFSAGLVPDPHNPSNPKFKSGPEYAKIQSLSQPNTPKSSHVHPIPSLYSYLPIKSGPANRAIAQPDTPDPPTTTIVLLLLIPQHTACSVSRRTTYSVLHITVYPNPCIRPFSTSGEGRYFHLHTKRYSPCPTDTNVHQSICLYIHFLIDTFIASLYYLSVSLIDRA